MILIILKIQKSSKNPNNTNIFNYSELKWINMNSIGNLKENKNYAFKDDAQQILPKWFLTWFIISIGILC